MAGWGSGPVQTVSDILNASSSTTVAKTMPGASVKSNTLTALVTWINNVTVTSVNDTDGNLWVAAGSRLLNSANQYNQLFHAIAKGVSTLSIQATFSGAAIYRGIVCEEYNHADGEGVFDGASSLKQTAVGPGSDVVKTGLWTVGGNGGALVYGFAQENSGLDYLTAGTGFTLSGGTLSFSGTVFSRGIYASSVGPGSQEGLWDSSALAHFYSWGASFLPPSYIAPRHDYQPYLAE